MANAWHVAVLKNGVEVWNWMREKGYITEPDLSEADLSYEDLNNINLENADLREAHLENADLRDAHLKNTDLIEAHLENAYLWRAHLENANLIEAHLENANQVEAYLENADLWRAHLENADLRWAHLKNANLSGAHLENANLGGAHLEYANLCRTILTRADLSRCDLRFTDVSEAYFQGCSFEGELSFYQKIKNLFSKIDWNFIRAVGSLQILTKASYMALLIVPLLSGLWPAVETVVNGYISKAQQVSEQIHEAALQLETVANSITENRGELASTVIVECATKITGFMDNANKMIQNSPFNNVVHPVFPASWAFAFFTALCVAIGHFIYQIRTPEQIRKTSRDQYILDYMRESMGLKQNQGINDYLRRSIAAIQAIAKILPDSRHPNLVYRNGMTYWIPTTYELIYSPKSNDEISEESIYHTENGMKEFKEFVSEDERILVTLNEGAKAEYDAQAREKRGSALVSLILYGVAMILLSIIVCEQSLKIIKHAGWFQ